MFQRRFTTESQQNGGDRHEFHSSRLVLTVAAASLVVAFGIVASANAASTSQPSKFYGCSNAKGNVEDISIWSGLTCPSV